MKSKITDKECPICHKKLTINKDEVNGEGEGEDIVSINTCNHLFHSSCINKWIEIEPIRQNLANTGRQLNCPACSENISSETCKQFNFKTFCECDSYETIVSPPSVQRYQRKANLQPPYSSNDEWYLLTKGETVVPPSYPDGNPPPWMAWTGGTRRRYKQKSHRRRGNSKKNRKRKSKKYLKKN